MAPVTVLFSGARDALAAADGDGVTQTETIDDGRVVLEERRFSRRLP